MASKQAAKRLSKEYQTMQKSPPPFVIARPSESNILEWHCILRGPPDTEYFGGEYYGMVVFPPEYPFKPPGLKMMTPSGRFQPNTAICTSASNFHPGSWNPAWSCGTILTGLLSFMVADEITTGSIRSTAAEKRALALSSHAWNISNAKFRLMFPEYATAQMKDLPDMGAGVSIAPITPATVISSNSLHAIKTPDEPASTSGLNATMATAPTAATTIRMRSTNWNKILMWTVLILLLSWAVMKVNESS